MVLNFEIEVVVNFKEGIVSIYREIYLSIFYIAL